MRWVGVVAFFKRAWETLTAGQAGPAADDVGYKRAPVIMGRSPGELRAVLESGIVGLRDIVETRYLSQQTAADAEARAAYADIPARMWAAFSESREVVDDYYCTYIPAAVVLKRPKLPGADTRRPYLEIELVYRPEASITTDPDIEMEIWKANSYFLDAWECKSLSRHDSIVKDIFLVLVELLSLADAQAMDGYEQNRTAMKLPKITAEVRQVKSEINRALLVQARRQYLTGTLFGALALGGGLVLIKYLVATLTHVHIDTRGLGTVVAGGIGAVLSVMTRLTGNNLSVDPAAGRRLVLLAGSFRPLIGGIFAFAVYVFVEGGLLPIRVTVVGLQATYFFLGIAFLAGFSERFAQDAVTRAGAVISDASRPSPAGNPGSDTVPADPGHLPRTITSL